MFPRRISSTATSAGRQNMICLELGCSCFGKSVFTVVPKTATQDAWACKPAYKAASMGRLHLYGSLFRAQPDKLGPPRALSERCLPW